MCSKHAKTIREVSGGVCQQIRRLHPSLLVRINVLVDCWLNVIAVSLCALAQYDKTRTVSIGLSVDSL